MLIPAKLIPRLTLAVVVELTSEEPPIATVMGSVPPPQLDDEDYYEG